MNQTAHAHAHADTVPRTLDLITQDINEVGAALRAQPSEYEVHKAKQVYGAKSLEYSLNRATIEEVSEAKHELAKVTDAFTNVLPHLQHKMAALHKERDEWMKQERAHHLRGVKAQAEKMIATYKTDCERTLETFKRIIALEREYGRPLHIEGWDTEAQRALHLPIIYPTGNWGGTSGGTA